MMSIFQTRLAEFLRNLNDKGLAEHLFRGGIGSVAIKVSNVILSAVLAVVLARALGPEGYGIYTYIFAMVSFLAIPAQFGLPRLVVRETAKAQVNGRWNLMLGLWRWASAMSVGLSIGIVLFGVILVWVWSDSFSELQRMTFFAGLMLVPLIALGNLRGAALQGMRYVVWGQLPEYVIRPGLFVLLLFAVVAWNFGKLDAPLAMGLHVLAAGIAFAIGAWLLYYKSPAPLRCNSAQIYKPRKWFISTWPLALTAGMQQVIKNTDIVTLGYFVPVEDVGIYRVAIQGAMLVIFGLQTVTMIVSPHYARLHAEGDFEQLQRVVTLSARVAFFAALPIVFVFVLWGDLIVHLMFGRDYVDAYVPLMILGFGQLINALFGPVGILLNMCGYERDTAWGMMIAAVMNVVLNLTLVPYFGMNGAAIATMLTLLMWNVLLWRNVHRRLAIDSSAVSFLLNSKSV